MPSSSKIREVVHGKLVWKDIEKPDEATLERLKDTYGFHELDLEDCLSKTESPKLEEYDDYVFVVFHFPIRNLRTESIDIESLNVFIGNNYLITLSHGRLKKLDETFLEMESDRRYRRENFAKGSGYLLYILMSELFESCFPQLSQIHHFIREIEGDIFEGKVAKDRLYDIILVKRQLINLKRAILPHAPIILQLEHLHTRFINKKLELYFDDVADKISRAKSLLSSMTDMIETLSDANESLTSHNTNRVMKILTIFSATLLPLTFITGLYGMNVPLPLENHSGAFFLVLSGMLGLLVVMLLFFKIKRWL
ncbi:MAG: magnesium transporter CorA family protein [bacterium]|nr:magnesium transporter CorA family protein [bacterium]